MPKQSRSGGGADTGAAAIRWSDFLAEPGSRTFLAVWLGQVVSLVGTGLTNFAVGIWIYETTGSVTLFSLSLAVGALPGILLSPVAGVVADRADRRQVMLRSIGVAAVRTVGLLALLAAGRLAPWHVYLLAAVGSASGAFRRPAYDAALPLLVSRPHLPRANGLVELGAVTGTIVAPLLAGGLMPVVGLRGILLMDLATFAVALLTLLLVRFPSQHGPVGKRKIGTGFWSEAREGWSFIHERKGLFTLLLFFALLNLGLGTLQALTTPLVLGFASKPVLGAVVAFGSAGMFLGGVLMTSWRGPARRVDGVLASGVVMGCGLMVAGLRPSPVTVAAGLFTVYAVLPVGNACSRTIWQTRVPSELQGRVFATRAAVSWITLPLAYAMAGPLADHVFGPLARAHGQAPWLRALVGAGTGRGIGMLLIATGAFVMAASFAGFRYPRLRRVEDPAPAA